jgi:hypothetical protein
LHTGLARPPIQCGPYAYSPRWSCSKEG